MSRLGPLLSRLSLSPMILLLGLAACADYQPAPLPDHADLAAGDWRRALAGLSVPVSAFPGAFPGGRHGRDLGGAGAHTVTLGAPLDMDAVAMLAVARNPDLRAARAQAGVTRAQAFAAGLLPDPQFSVERGFLTSGPGTVSSIALGLMQDVMPFLTLSSRRRGAEATTRGADLALLWQEWQVVAQARLLVVRLDALARQRALVAATRDLFDRRARLTRAAMDRGDQTLPPLISDLAALTAAQTQLDDLDQQILRNRLDLNALLDLSPDVELPLAPVDGDHLAADLGLPDAATIRADLPRLAGRRPDLLALRAGYAAQEEAVRQAVVLQFPSLAIGTNRASDTSNIKTQSLAVSFALPLFNHNAGGVRVEEATREALRQDYQARLDAACGGVGAALAVIGQMRGQLDALGPSLRDLEQAQADAAAAYAAGNLDERSYADLQAALLARRGDALRLRQLIAEQQVALATLLGGEVPPPTPGAAVREPPPDTPTPIKPAPIKKDARP